jgi:hypothetical protein
MGKDHKGAVSIDEPSRLDGVGVGVLHGMKNDKGAAHRLSFEKNLAADWIQGRPGLGAAGTNDSDGRHYPA